MARPSEMQAACMLLHSYVTARQTVRKARAQKLSQAATSALLIKSCQGPASGLVLRGIATKLKSKTREAKKWANVRKRDDRVAKLLRERVPVKKASKNRWDQADLHALIAEAMRARALCVTSERYQASQLPSEPVESRLRPWALYGRCAPYDKALAKH